MSVMGPLAAFTLKAAFNTSVDQLLGWIGARFSNPSQPLQRALMRANDHAWKCVGFALAGEELFERVKPWFPDRDLSPLRASVRAYAAYTPTGLGTAPAGLRLQACAELTRLRRAGRLTLLVDRNEVVVDLWRCGDPALVVQGAEEAVARVADALATEAPHLTRVVRLAPVGGVPLLAAAFLYFFRREVEVTPDLARGLAFDSIRAATAAAERGIVFVDGPPPGVLDHFDMLFDPLTDWFQRAVHELGTLRKELREWREANRFVAAAVDAPLSILAFGERERMLIFHGRLRQLPGELVEVADWQGLGDNLDACGLFKEARAAHTAAAAQAKADADPVQEAENYFRIYKDACEGAKWPEAKDALNRATKLDATRFRPFDISRYKIDAVLGVSGFATVFRCLDTDDLDAEGNPLPVVIKALRCDSLDRGPRAVFAEARALRDLHRPGNHIARVLGWGYAHGDPDQPTRKERPYLVTEFFPGETLDAIVRRYGPMPADLFLSVALQIAKAVRAAHAKGVWHRDLTPSNVMSRTVDNDWDVRVIDFGLAAPHDVVYHASLNQAAKRATVRDRSLTRSLEFSSPEQRGKLPGVPVGPYSDVYAFGKTCLWLLFQTTHPQPHHWATVPDGVRAPLQSLLERATAETPDVRPQDFAAVIAGLNACYPQPEPPPAPLAEAVEVPAAVSSTEETPQAIETVEVLEPASAVALLDPASAVALLDPASAVTLLEPAEAHDFLESIPAHEGGDPAERTAVLEPVDPAALLELVEDSEASPPDEPPAVAPHEGAEVAPEIATTVVAPPEHAPPPPEPEPKPRDGGVSTKDPLHPGRDRVAGERFTIKLPGNLPLTFAWCPAGTFQMGSDRSDANADEKPVHAVTLSHGFFIGIYPVTQAQWKAALMGNDPSHFPGPDRPVEQVLWEESQRFCRQMSRQLKGRAKVRLPTEAEWEYACCAGTGSEYNSGDGEESLQKAGWYEGNSGKETHPVGQLAANAWGVHDMHGNVWEWCLDWYGEYHTDEQTDPVGPDAGTDRVFRGGGWGDSARFCRSTYRSWFDPAVRYDALGFRIVLVLGG